MQIRAATDTSNQSQNEDGIKAAETHTTAAETRRDSSSQRTTSKLPSEWPMTHADNAWQQHLIKTDIASKQNNQAQATNTEPDIKCPNAQPDHPVRWKEHGM